MDGKRRRKLTVVGNAGVGKTALLTMLLTGVFPNVRASQTTTGTFDLEFAQGHIPSTMDVCIMSFEVKQQPLRIVLWDTSPHDSHARIWLSPAYNNADAILVCFSVDSPGSFVEVEKGWAPEIRDFIGDSVPVYLVACKADLRTEPETINRLASHGQRVITTDQGEQMAARIGAAAYFECSSKTGEGIRPLFLHALEAMHDRTYPPIKMSRSRGMTVKGTGCIIA